jgi:hypothetical protein
MKELHLARFALIGLDPRKAHCGNCTIDHGGRITFAAARRVATPR